MVALRPHRLTTLLGKQVGVGVSPSLDEVLLYQIELKLQTNFSVVNPATLTVSSLCGLNLGAYQVRQR